MDGCTGTDEISNIFKDKYENLYNSVGYQSQDLEKLTKDIEQRINDGCPTSTNHVHNISVKEVKDAITLLKSGKKEENCLYSDHFKAGSHRLIVTITLLFNCMLVHGIAPDEFLLGIMIPLIKKS